MVAVEDVKDAIGARFPEVAVAEGDSSGSPVYRVPSSAVVEVCAFLKEDPRLEFDYLMSLTAVDWTDRFEVVYHLYSITRKHYVTIKANVERTSPVLPSVTGVWNAADWQEREVYDMFGIEFEGHPDLRRILLEEDWVGYPLRKDYQE
jgi:NADH-quinone oxidoreductase subunit C